MMVIHGIAHFMICLLYTSGGDGGLTTAERQRLKELERETRELHRSNNILRQASAYFAKAEFDRLWKK